MNRFFLDDSQHIWDSTWSSSRVHWSLCSGRGCTLIWSDWKCCGFKPTRHCKVSTLKCTTPGSVLLIAVSCKKTWTLGAVEKLKTQGSKKKLQRFFERTQSSVWMNRCSCLRIYTQPRNLSSGDRSGPVDPGISGDGQQSDSSASWVRRVGTAPAHDLCGRTLDMWLPDLWSEDKLPIRQASDCGLWRAAWPGLCPGLAGDGRGTLGDPGQLEAAGEAMLCDEGNGLPSMWPASRKISLHVIFFAELFRNSLHFEKTDFLLTLWHELVR